MVLTQPDPLSAILAEYRSQCAVFEAMPEPEGQSETKCEAQIAQTWGPLFDRLRTAPPPATSLHGVRDAVAFVLDQERGGNSPMTRPVLRAALAFLQGGSQGFAA